MTIASTKERAGQYDAIETAKPGEPLFPLQGGDPFAPELVLLWAERARTAARGNVAAAEADRLMRKATNAEEIAWSMQAYQRGDTELPAVPASYSGNEAPADRTRVAALASIADRIYNSIAELGDAADALEGLGDDFVLIEANQIRATVMKLGRIVSAIEPRRHLQRRSAT